MPKVSLTVLDLNNKYLDLLSTVLDTSRSQVLNDILEHIRTEDLEPDIWDAWEGAYEVFEELVKVEEEEEAEEEEEEED